MKKPSLAIAIIPKAGPSDEGESNLAPDVDPRARAGGAESGMSHGVGQLCLPQDVVATADDKDQKVAPEVGDQVRFDCVARVTRVEGGDVYLAPTEVNGTPVGGQNHEETPDTQGPDPDDEQAMRELAQQADGGAN